MPVFESILRDFVQGKESAGWMHGRKYDIPGNFSE